MIERSQLKFPSAFGLALEGVLEELGIASVLPFILDKAGISDKQFRDPNFSYDGDQVLYLLRQFEKLPAGFIPVKIAIENWTWSSTGFLALAGMSSRSLKDAVEIGMRFSHMYLPAIEFNITTESEETRLAVELGVDFEEMSPTATELIICAIKHIADENLEEPPPFKIHFKHSNTCNLSDAEAKATYSEFMGCEVIFNSYFSGISGPEDFALTRLRNANDATRAMALEMLEKLDLKNDHASTFGDRVIKILHQTAEEDVYLSLGELAEQLHVTPRTLIRRLAKEGLQFKTLINKVRINKAKNLLCSTDMPVKLVAHKTGYKDSNAFIRAFKNQVGKTPAAWRTSSAM